ncbi:hypothetical protein CC80DRAFT_542506 [Byssothecium circinans]|uniref:Uncharacterized protein n=1 Tax=Byssothecium circinans TaxID=147558 RepID=A0A6A5UEL9_9PLEO|nr:hypothetical protein CC80DRAFT_542506 [Byssothecium circinans]
MPAANQTLRTRTNKKARRSTKAEPKLNRVTMILAMNMLGLSIVVGLVGMSLSILGKDHLVWNALAACRTEISEVFERMLRALYHWMIDVAHQYCGKRMEGCRP